MTSLGLEWREVQLSVSFGLLEVCPEFCKAFRCIEKSTVAAERKEMYRFSVDMAKLALRIADRYSGSGEKWYAFLRRIG
jgi:hypothetical protein